VAHVEKEAEKKPTMRDVGFKRAGTRTAATVETRRNRGGIYPSSGKGRPCKGQNQPSERVNVIIETVKHTIPKQLEPGGRRC